MAHCAVRTPAQEDRGSKKPQRDHGSDHGLVDQEHDHDRRQADHHHGDDHSRARALPVVSVAGLRPPAWFTRRHEAQPLYPGSNSHPCLDLP